MGSKKKRNRPKVTNAEEPSSTSEREIQPVRSSILPTHFISVRKILIFAFLGSFLVLASVWAYRNGKTTPVATTVALAGDEGNFDGSYIPSPLTYQALLKLSPELLDKVDVGTMDLLCAQGLPGSENLDVGANLSTLDAWAGRVKMEEENNLRRYFDSPGLFRNSLSYFRTVLLVSSLNDLGCLPDKDRTNDESNASFFADSKSIFIHGLLGPHHGGTCSSIPILIVAVSQRLGFLIPDDSLANVPFSPKA